jgi:hypothetical protein
LINIIKVRTIKYILFFIGLSVIPCKPASGQEINLSGSVQWKPLLKSIDPSSGKEIQLLHFENAIYNGHATFLPYFEGKVKLNSNGNEKYKIDLTQTYFEEIPPDELATASSIFNIGDSIQINYSIAQEKKTPYLRYSFVPIRKNLSNGRIERLKFFSIKISPIFAGNVLKSGKAQIQSYLPTGRFADQSVLSTGEWYKFQVNKSGIYKISFNDLKNLGLQNPEQVRIYGNGGKMLPEVYTGNIPDDPEEIPIMMMTGSDGVFNENDYIVFYAEGPVTWSFDNSKKSFFFEKHKLSDYAVYFITSAAGGKRIVPIESPNNDPTVQVNTFDGLDCHEENLFNLIRSGRTWYGEDFKLNNSYDFNFSFPNLVATEQVTFEAEVLGRSDSPNFFQFQQNNQPIGSVSINPVDINNNLSDYANIALYSNKFLANSDKITIRVGYNNNGSSTGEGWLSYLKITARQSLTMNSTQLAFRDIRSVGSGNIALYNIANADANVQVWDVTNLHNTNQMNGTLQGNTYSFKATADSLHEYIAFNPQNSLLSPVFIKENNGKIANQNLHGMRDADLIIISHPNFLIQAQELADLHYQNDGLSFLMVTPEQVYNEFSSGLPDPAAIRNFMKMLYDKATSPGNIPKYLLLLGDGSYDNKTPISTDTKNTNYIITYESSNSLSPSVSYVSDDYFGLLDDNENITTGLLDIGIGRLPVQTAEQAENLVKKIRKYIDHKSFGDWRNNICFIGDDEDNNMHMEQANLLATYVSDNYPSFNIEKIYLDAYPQISTSTGQRYPDVTLSILNQLNRGSLIVNYTGHGGEQGLAAEQIITQSDIINWNNDQYPLFVTATCEFGRYDDYQITSAGENVLLNPQGGGIGLLTTSRVVYSSQNYDLNHAFYQNAFVKTDDNPAFRLGDIVRKTKNSAGSDINKLCFTLLGDPALSLAYPKCNSIVTDSINHKPSDQADTLNAYGSVTISGHIIDETGQKMSNFSGIINPTIFDKFREITTLANDNGTPFTFHIQNNVLFKGKATVKNGEFTFDLILPRDINYNFGFGKIGYYAYNTTSDVSGCFSKVILGGMTTNITTDSQGPDIKLYMNDTTFINGGITSEYPTLLARVSDENGINPGGNSIGHDILAVLDNDPKQNFVLNSYFQTDIDNYKRGSVAFKFPKLTPGEHLVIFKIWDIFNNSSQSELKFSVQGADNMRIQRVFNYPNPFSDYTNFFFEHNQNNGELNVTIEIFNMTGSKVKELKTQISPSGFTSEPIFWDGKDENGNKIRGGIYIYRIILRSLKGYVFSESQKLIVIN